MQRIPDFQVEPTAKDAKITALKLRMAALEGQSADCSTLTMPGTGYCKERVELKKLFSGGSLEPANEIDSAKPADRRGGVTGDNGALGRHQHQYD